MGPPGPPPARTRRDPGVSVRRMLSVWAISRLVAGKDLRVEWRSRVVSNQVVPFAGLMMVMFAFALDSDTVLKRVAPTALPWLLRASERLYRQ